MRAVVTAILAGILAAAISPPAAARAAVDSRATRVIHDIAHCVVLANVGRARAFLAMPANDRAYGRSFRHLVERNNCLERGSIGADNRVFKGAIAEELLLRDLHGDPLGAHVAYDPSRPPIRVAGETEVMSICVVRAAPEQVLALLRTEPASSSEADALRVIAPYLPDCLRRGMRAELDRSILRAMLASAAYRLNGAGGIDNSSANGARIVQ